MVGVNQPQIHRLTSRAVNIPGDQHDFPKHPEKVLPKFAPHSREYFEDRINKFMVYVSLMKLYHEYVIFILFPYTFEGRTSTWYFALTVGSITS
jgi:hypothetical protein